MTTQPTDPQGTCPTCHHHWNDHGYRQCIGDRNLCQCKADVPNATWDGSRWVRAPEAPSKAQQIADSFEDELLEREVQVLLGEMKIDHVHGEADVNSPYSVKKVLALTTKLRREAVIAELCNVPVSDPLSVTADYLQDRVAELRRSK